MTTLATLPLSVLLLLAAPSADGDEDDAPVLLPAAQETVTVSASRLPLDPEPIEDVPAHVTVRGEESIARSGARTLQDLLAGEAGVIAYDQYGNGLATTFDLRGFREGTGTAVLLDGVRMNDPRANTIALELIPLEGLGSVELVRGPAAATVGGGAEAGVLHVLTAAGGPTRGSVTATAGTDDTSRLSASAVARAFGDTTVSVAAARDATDGFRPNSGGDLERALLRVAHPISSSQRLDLTVLVGERDLQAPGALTDDEWRDDPSGNRFNLLDVNRDRLRQASLGWTATLGPVRLATTVYGREVDAEGLTTGRSAPVFGGFFVDTRTSVVGSAVQAALPRGSHTLVAGVEWLDGDVDALGVITPPDDPGSVDRSAPASDNTTGRRSTAVFVQDEWRPLERLVVVLGARHDRDRLDYEERAAAVPEDTRTFSETSGRAGVTWKAAPHHSLHAAFSQAFLAPTVEELFAFPGFFSNRELRPQSSDSWELGYHLQGDDGSLQVAAFRIDTTDEIVFRPGGPPDFAGTNVNEGRTRRDGLEVAARTVVSGRIELRAAGTWIDARIRHGEHAGHRLPLVPELRLSAGLRASLPHRVQLDGDLLWVDEQRLDGDDAAAWDPLPSWTRLDLRAGWTPARTGGITWLAEVRNVLDRTYATRGIAAFDAAAGVTDRFVTPAPGRRFALGARWAF